MGLTVCPAAVVKAPAEVVWGNIIHWDRYSEWFDRSLHVEHSEPEGPAVVGQTISFAGRALGLTMRFLFKVEGVDPGKYTLDLYASFPFGLQMRPHISCYPIDAVSCRVQYG